ncbi:defense protein l(2)34Fc-like [Penaeus japonicus]|uniref:defense protein l(2)34Fc-like n=1 Tax=Penaeus japonicus TaxID=27405 RepID=UPI001C70D1CE|nr:defense protein l(2)34Fc-like [Penaeus japonicus]
MRLVLTSALVVSLSLVAHGWPSGAPVGACADMNPQHGPGAQLLQNQQYALSSTQNTDGTYTVSIIDQLGDTFKGFMVRGYVNGSPAGVFINPPKGVACDGVDVSGCTLHLLLVCCCFYEQYELQCY